VKCPKCQTENPEGKKFCGECGAKLERVCPECSSPNPPQFKFCGECGRPLSPFTPAPPLDYSHPQSYTPKFLAEKILTTRSSVEGERKLVTVLFADVANFTSLSEKLDPEEIHGIMDGCFKILMDEIHKYEGTINQFTGDGVMALFGAPLAHEDHAVRACYTSLAIQHALTDYGEKLKKTCGIDFKMRIGLNSGPVVVGAIGDDLRMDYTAIGDTINLASRMQSNAQPGSILVSGHTQRLTKDYFAFSSLGAIQMKGKEEPQDAYVLIQASEVRTRLEASAVAGLTRFVGRAKEMETLREALEKARSGQGQVVGIVGEAGVGKSRIILEMRHMFPDYTYLEGRCLHYGGSMAYLPLTDILRSYFGIKEGEREYLINKKMKEKVASLDEHLITAVAPFQDLLSLEPDEEYRHLEPKQRRERIFEALRDLFIRESQKIPLILIAEDLHWIDKTSEEFLDYLIGWLATTPILLIILYRPEYTHRWGSKSFYTNIRVDQLSLSTSSELVQSILSEGEIVPELRDLILGKAAGNPLFMEELTHSLLENGSIEKKDDHYTLSRKLSDIQVPDTVQGIIASRIDRLDESLKRIMHVASVIGREFAFRILQSITEMKEELKTHLVNLQGLELIYEKRLFPELEYIFKHALTQEVAYNSLLLARRKEIHGKIGRAIEELYADRLHEFYEMLAYHYSKSDDLAKGVGYGEKAAARAASVYAYVEAAQLLEQAIEVQQVFDPQDKAKRCDLLLALGDALRLGGQARRARDVELAEAYSLAESIGDRARASRACTIAILCFWYLGDISIESWAGPEEALWAERADRYAEEGTLARAWADQEMGQVRYWTGLFTKQHGLVSEAVRLFSRALDVARRLGDPETFWFVAARAWLMYVDAPQHTVERRRLAEEMATQPRARVSEETIGMTQIFTGGALIESGQRQRAEECFADLKAIAERSRQGNLLIVSRLADAFVATLDGRLDDVIALCRQAEDLGKELGLPGYGVLMETLGAQTALLHMGKFDELVRLLDLVKFPPGALLLAYLHRDAETVAALDELISSRAGLVPSEDETGASSDMQSLQAAILVGHREAAEFLVRRCAHSRLHTTNPIVGMAGLTCPSRHLGAAAAFLGRPEEARTYYEEALDMATGLRSRPEIALTRLQLAELLLAHFPDEKAEALEHLDFAIEEFREMKMQPSFERALKDREALKD
jgi:class 3 adenylate cyclase/tetratricopeptide (TPR) repeat protein